MCEIFKKLNAPFPYEDYEVNKDDGRVYVKGQAVAERLNEVLGVGYWAYEPIISTMKAVDTGRQNKNGGKIKKMFLLVKFSFYNKETKEWISFVDAGSQDMNRRMEEGDAAKAAITDGLKKCASRLGVASDLYKGEFQVVNNKVILPTKYKEYYKEKGWKGVFVGKEDTSRPKNAKRQAPREEQKAGKKTPLQQLQEEFNVPDVLFGEMKQKYKNNPQKIRQALEYLKNQKAG